MHLKSGEEPSKISNRVLKKLTEFGSMKEKGKYSTLDTSSLLDGISNIISVLTYFISGVAGISLLIAGVGVMNMMFTSVSERSYEIGIRRALGAKKRDIRNQFLIEGLILTVVSGIIEYIFQIT